MSTITSAPLLAESAPANIAAPPAEAFASWPRGWYVFGPSREVSEKPVSKNIFGRRVVVYRRADDRTLVALAAQCWHLGADLGGGCVVGGDRIRCPFHGWEFSHDGRCAHILADAAIPPDARQATYAVAERAGVIFVFPAPIPTFPPPFFHDVDPDALVAADPFEFVLDCPWWLVGTNGFDVQHFLGAHDRRLLAPPLVTSPAAWSRRVVAEFEVCGGGWRDRLTRVFSGPRVMMDVTVSAGTLVFVAARFRRTTTYGMVDITPDPDRPHETRVRVHIFISKRLGRPIDGLDLRIRRSFIRAFLEPDARLLHGASYLPHRLIDADRLMIDYLNWLAPVSHGRANSKEQQP